MYKYLFSFLGQVLLFSSCNTSNIRAKDSEPIKFNYVYHFYKQELEESHIQPAAYKPKFFNINGMVSAQLFKGDSVLKFVYKSDKTTDSTIELFHRVDVSDKQSDKIPTTLLGCKFLGVFNSSKEEIPDDFYYCFYLGENNNLLNVVHLYKIGNVSAAFFYTNNNVDPTTKNKTEMAKLFFAEQKLNETDTVNLTNNVRIK